MTKAQRRRKIKMIKAIQRIKKREPYLEIDDGLQWAIDDLQRAIDAIGGLDWGDEDDSGDPTQSEVRAD